MSSSDSRPLDPLHIYGMHDWSSDWGNMAKAAGKTAWCVQTFEIGFGSQDIVGQDFSGISNRGISVIGRLNHSHHGQGTIPARTAYGDFAKRCANFVRASNGCWNWIIGNEPNLVGERPDGVAITPEDYAQCFSLCRQAIKAVNPTMRIIVAPVAPYNVDSGDWLLYWSKVLSFIQYTGADGLGIHTYSRGGDPNSVSSLQKMDHPYETYYNGFLAYRDFLANVPTVMRTLPVFITETDQNDPWVDANSGWVRRAYGEIDNWNKSSGTQKIFCLCLYRWNTDDKWQISTKKNVGNDFYQTMRETDFRVPEIVNPAIALVAPWLRVTAPAGANIRRGPGTDYQALTAVPQGQPLKAVGRNADSSWWQVVGPYEGAGWVSNTIVQVAAGTAVPIVKVDPPAFPVPPKPQALNKDWVIYALSRTLGIDPLLGKAIFLVESGGRGFEGDRMIIRFENHVFLDSLRKLTPSLEGKFHEHFKFGTPWHTGHEWRPTATAPWEKQHDGGQAEEWQVFSFARTIHNEAAMLAISMGAAQILGINFATVGYTSVREMFEDYNQPVMGEYNQLVGFFAYVANRSGLLGAAKSKDWMYIATLYNGKGQEGYYGPLLRQKYLELGGKD